MALLSDYTAGTVASSGNVITGTGTAWAVAEFREGDIFTADGWNVIIASVDSDTQLTVDPNRGVVGAALSGAEYGLRYMSDGSRASAQARQLIDMLGGSGNLEALGGLVGVAGKIPMFTGPGTMALTDPGNPDPNGNLAAIGGLTSAPDMLPFFTGAGAAGITGFTAFARTLLDDANASEFWGTLGATSPPNIAYRRGNILGVVGQSGGVPTGAVIERGSNANGQYVRWADGTQKCWGGATSDDITDVAAGALFRANAARTFTFPASFVSVPALSGNVDKSNGGMGSNWATVTTGYPTATQVSLIMLGNTVTAYGRLSYDAVGRWF